MARQFRFFLLCGVIAAAMGCTRVEPIATPFSDAFDRATLGNTFLNTGGPYEIKDGKLHVAGAYNHPLWLRRSLPANAEVELDVMSPTDNGDIKVEIWGDGESYDSDRGSYLATSYVFIQGGWHNTVSALCRLDEHAPDRVERKDKKVEKNRVYHWKIQRQGNTIRWFVDNELFLEMNDSDPLEGNNHAFLGFNNWETPVVFDNLKIRPL